MRSISITNPSDLKTSRGIHIGSTDREVVEAYGRFLDPEEGSEEDKRFVAGSIYDGMIFDFEDGRVIKIFLGASAE